MRSLISKLLSLSAVVLLVASCKKNDDKPNPTIGFTYSGTISSPNDTLNFTALTKDANSVSWNFGDGTTASGFTVSHVFSGYGCYSVSATAVNDDGSTTATKEVPFTMFRKVIVKSVEVIQTPPFAYGGVSWDPNDDPDLNLKIVLPDDTVYTSGITISNSTTGLFTLSPQPVTYGLGDKMSFEIYDKDLGSNPELYLMGYANFSLCPPIPNSGLFSYNDSTNLQNGSLRLKVKYTWSQ
jgi:PKD repeat protein